MSVVDLVRKEELGRLHGGGRPVVKFGVQLARQKV
jgi:hypothetical protein